MREHLFDIAPDHKPRHVILAKPHHRFGHDMAAIAQHGHTVGNRLDFIKLMGNIKDRDTLRAQTPDLIKQDFNLPPGQNRRRFIQNQDIGLFAQRLGNFHHLAIRNRKIANTGTRIDIALKLIQKPLGLCAHRGFIKEPSPLDLTTQKDVFFNAKLFGKVKLLMDQDNPMPLARLAIGKADLRPVKDKPALGRFVIARQDFNQR